MTFTGEEEAFISEKLNTMKWVCDGVCGQIDCIGFHAIHTKKSTLKNTKDSCKHRKPLL